MRKSYIYKIINIDTGEFYIGSQCSGKTIGKDYFTSSSNKEFVYDFKHNKDAYLIKIIATFSDKESCILEENIMIKRHFNDKGCLNRSYRINDKSVFSTAGKHLSEETRKKLSEAQKGKHLSEETRKKLSEAQKGKHQSEETRKKISEAKKGNKNNLGKHLSEETRKKMSEAMKGKNIGKHLSEETRKKMSEAQKGKHWKLIDGKRVWY